MERTILGDEFKGGIWHTFFTAVDNKEGTLRLILDEKKKFYKLFYPFLEKKQILGKVYEELGIPHVCGDVNRKKLYKLFLQQRNKGLWISKKASKKCNKNNSQRYPTLSIENNSRKKSIIKKIATPTTIKQIEVKVHNPPEKSKRNTSTRVTIKHTDVTVCNDQEKSENDTDFDRLIVPTPNKENNTKDGTSLNKCSKKQKSVRFNDGIEVYRVSPSQPSYKLKPLGRLFDEPSYIRTSNNQSNNCEDIEKDESNSDSEYDADTGITSDNDNSDEQEEDNSNIKCDSITENYKQDKDTVTNVKGSGTLECTLDSSEDFVSTDSDTAKEGDSLIFSSKMVTVAQGKWLRETGKIIKNKNETGQKCDPTYAGRDNLEQSENYSIEQEIIEKIGILKISTNLDSENRIQEEAFDYAGNHVDSGSNKSNVNKNYSTYKQERDGNISTTNLVTDPLIIADFHKLSYNDVLSDTTNETGEVSTEKVVAKPEKVMDCNSNFIDDWDTTSESVSEQNILSSSREMEHTNVKEEVNLETPLNEKYISDEDYSLRTVNTDNSYRTSPSLDSINNESGEDPMHIKYLTISDLSNDSIRNQNSSTPSNNIVDLNEPFDEEKEMEQKGSSSSSTISSISHLYDEHNISSLDEIRSPIRSLITKPIMNQCEKMNRYKSNETTLSKVDEIENQNKESNTFMFSKYFTNSEGMVLGTGVICIPEAFQESDLKIEIKNLNEPNLEILNRSELIHPDFQKINKTVKKIKSLYETKSTLKEDSEIRYSLVIPDKLNKSSSHLDERDTNKSYTAMKNETCEDYITKVEKWSVYSAEFLGKQFSPSQSISSPTNNNFTSSQREAIIEESEIKLIDKSLKYENLLNSGNEKFKSWYDLVEEIESSPSNSKFNSNNEEYIETGSSYGTSSFDEIRNNNIDELSTAYETDSQTGKLRLNRFSTQIANSSPKVLSLREEHKIEELGAQNTKKNEEINHCHETKTNNQSLTPNAEINLSSNQNSILNQNKLETGCLSEKHKIDRDITAEDLQKTKKTANEIHINFSRCTKDLFINDDKLKSSDPDKNDSESIIESSSPSSHKESKDKKHTKKSIKEIPLNGEKRKNLETTNEILSKDGEMNLSRKQIVDNQNKEKNSNSNAVICETPTSDFELESSLIGGKSINKNIIISSESDNNFTLVSKKFIDQDFSINDQNINSKKSNLLIKHFKKPVKLTPGIKNSLSSLVSHEESNLRNYDVVEDCRKINEKKNEFRGSHVTFLIRNAVQNNDDIVSKITDNNTITKSYSVSQNNTEDKIIPDKLRREDGQLKDDLDIKKNDPLIPITVQKRQVMSLVSSKITMSNDYRKSKSNISGKKRKLDEITTVSRDSKCENSGEALNISSISSSSVIYDSESTISKDSSREILTSKKVNTNIRRRRAKWVNKKSETVGSTSSEDDIKSQGTLKRKYSDLNMSKQNSSGGLVVKRKLSKQNNECTDEENTFKMNVKTLALVMESIMGDNNLSVKEGSQKIKKNIINEEIKCTKGINQLTGNNIARESLKSDFSNNLEINQAPYIEKPFEKILTSGVGSKVGNSGSLTDSSNSIIESSEKNKSRKRNPLSQVNSLEIQSGSKIRTRSQISWAMKLKNVKEKSRSISDKLLSPGKNHETYNKAFEKEKNLKNAKTAVIEEDFSKKQEIRKDNSISSGKVKEKNTKSSVVCWDGRNQSIDSPEVNTLFRRTYFMGEQ